MIAFIKDNDIISLLNLPLTDKERVDYLVKSDKIIYRYSLSRLLASKKEDKSSIEAALNDKSKGIIYVLEQYPELKSILRVEEYIHKKSLFRDYLENLKKLCENKKDSMNFQKLYGVINKLIPMLNEEEKFSDDEIDKSWLEFKSLSSIITNIK